MAEHTTSATTKDKQQKNSGSNIFGDATRVATESEATRQASQSTAAHDSDNTEASNKSHDKYRHHPNTGLWPSADDSNRQFYDNRRQPQSLSRQFNSSTYRHHHRYRFRFNVRSTPQMQTTGTASNVLPIPAPVHQRSRASTSPSEITAARSTVATSRNGTQIRQTEQYHSSTSTTARELRRSSTVLIQPRSSSPFNGALSR